jgi:hypothetical protein
VSEVDIEEIIRRRLREKREKLLRQLGESERQEEK